MATFLLINTRSDSYFVTGVSFARPVYFDSLRAAPSDSRMFSRGPAPGHRLTEGEGIVLGTSWFTAGRLLASHDGRYRQLTIWIGTGSAADSGTVILGSQADAVVAYSEGNPAYAFANCYGYVESGTLWYAWVHENEIRMRLSAPGLCDRAEFSDEFVLKRVRVDELEPCTTRSDFASPHLRPCLEQAPEPRTVGGPRS